MQAFLDWLVLDFDVYGFHVQHWIVMAAGIFAIFLIVNWECHLGPPR